MVKKRDTHSATDGLINMKYDIYSSGYDDKCRFSLGKNGQRKLFVIGLNPSRASQEKSDTTIAKVEHIAKQNDFDGFVMLNLYPLRATDLQSLPIEPDQNVFNENLDEIDKILSCEEKPIIWAAWGENIHNRKFFLDAGKEILKISKKYEASWMHFGDLTQSGHPRHPSRANYSWDLSAFSIEKYWENIK